MRNKVITASAVGLGAILVIVLAYRTNTQTRVVAAVAGDVKVYEDELPAEAQGELAQLRHQEYEIKVRAFQNLLVRRLLEAEAARRKISLEQLMEAEARTRVPQPGEKELRAWFEQKKAYYDKPFEQIQDRVRADFTEERLRDAKRQYVQETWRAAPVEVLLPPPRMAVRHDPERMRGNPQAPVMMVEFSDFQCPFCRRVQPTINALLEKYPHQLALSYRDYPLVELHPMAHISAQAARCAGAQGKFWEYHNALFGFTGQPTRETLGKFAADLQLDGKAFASCLDSGSQKQAVDADFQAGTRAGVNSTPVFFINGIYLSGAQPLEDFIRIIDRELKSKK
jgi:protein-disulfide isomerase